MTNVRSTGRLCALALSAMVVAGLFASTPASADNAEAFAGSAAARALNLNALGIKVTAGSTDALATSSPEAHAKGAGLALIADSASKADATAAGQNPSTPQACALHIPISGILDVAAACSQSAASTLDANPLAASTATVAAIDVGLVNLVLQLLQPILDALTPVLDQVIGTVTGTLQPLLGGLLDPLLGSLNLDLNSPVSSLVDALKNVTNLATVHVGDTASTVTTDAGKVSAVATAKGGEVDVLPGLAVTGAPLLSIVLGSARATSTFDRSTGQSSSAFDPSLLTLQVLGINVPIGLGAPVTLFAGTVLESTISIGAGRTIQNPDGTVGAVADGVSLQLLKGLNGGIVLELAHAESAVGGAKALITTQSVNPPAEVQAVELARTGAEAPWLEMGLMLILAAFVSRRLGRRWMLKR
ncbi:MAG: hypothetical protein V7605_1745 [Acidimicrobiaceae bacterium]